MIDELAEIGHDRRDVRIRLGRVAGGFHHGGGQRLDGVDRGRVIARHARAFGEHVAEALRVRAGQARLDPAFGNTTQFGARRDAAQGLRRWHARFGLTVAGDQDVLSVSK